MTFKPLNENDAVNTRTLLHEAIPLTGSIISGSYLNTSVSPPQPTNVKTYPHGMFQTVYDYNYLSSSANHIFDMTFGISPQALGVLTFGSEGMSSKKRNIYGQMAQVLMGYDAKGIVQRFDGDGNLFDSTGDKMDFAFVLPFSRLLVKDEIKKESFSMTIDLSTFNASIQPFTTLLQIGDIGASNEYRVNSPAGEYGILYGRSETANVLKTGNSLEVEINDVKYQRCGLIFYQAGIVILSAGIFSDDSQWGILQSNLLLDSDNSNMITMMQDKSINDANAALRHRIKNIQFNNTTELNSTVYFCRVNHNEFNYSSNPTYLENSRIRVKTQATDDPVAYITTVGLYNDRNELLATAKLSEPLKKSPSQEFTIRARLDY